MTTLTDRYPDLLQTDDPELAHIVTGLNTMGRSTTAAELPAERDRAIRNALLTQAREPRAGSGNRRLISPRRSRPTGRRVYQPRIASIATALLIVVAGIAGYVHLQTPTPVSAARVLNRAAAAVVSPAPGDVVHEVMTDTARFPTSPGGGVPAGATYLNTVEQWSRFASADTVDRFSLSWVVNGALVERIVLNDQANWFYDPKQNSVTKDKPLPMRLDTTPENVIWPKTIMTQPPNPGALRTLLLTAATAPDTELLAQQTIDGSLVDVVQITHVEPIPPSTKVSDQTPPVTVREIFTLYIDASTYTVRRLEQRDVDVNGVTLDTDSLQLTKDETIPASQVPSNIFDFTPPPGAQIRNCLATESCSPPPAGK